MRLSSGLALLSCSLVSSGRVPLEAWGPIPAGFTLRAFPGGVGVGVGLGVGAAGPGTYAHYPAYSVPTPANATVFEVEHTWRTLPAASETEGNAVFMSTQMWHTGGAGGYMGTQVWRDDSGAGAAVETHRAIFSMWDGVDPATGRPVATGWKGPNCERFGGEGLGSHCLNEFAIKQGATYTLRYESDGGNHSGAFWTGSIVEGAGTASASGGAKRTVIGTLFYPDLSSAGAAAGGSGYGPVAVNAASFQEYFLATGCDGQALSGATLGGPYFGDVAAVADKAANPRRIVATRATPDFAGDCLFSDVRGEGAPVVLMLAGGETARTTNKTTELW